METEEKQIILIESLSKPEAQETTLEYFEDLLLEMEITVMGFRSYIKVQDLMLKYSTNIPGFDDGTLDVRNKLTAFVAILRKRKQLIEAEIESEKNAPQDTSTIKLRLQEIISEEI